MAKVIKKQEKIADIQRSNSDIAQLFSCLPTEDQDELLRTMREKLAFPKYDKFSDDEIISNDLEYFEDIMFEPHSIIDEFIKCRSIGSDGSTNQLFNGYHMGLIENGFKVYIKDLDDDVGGQSDYENKEIFINSEYSDDKATILHEMIHAHEVILDSRELFYHDIILLCLYNNLKDKIPDLDAKIMAHTHVVNGEKISERGNSHNILFFLKSLDLDLRCGFELGTVCSYGRKEMFNGHSNEGIPE